MDAPIEQASQTYTVVPRYIAHWGPGHDNPGAAIKLLHNFNQAAGFSDDEFLLIADLEPGKMVHFCREENGVSFDCSITRMPDDAATLLDQAWALKQENESLKETLEHLGSYTQAIRDVMKDIKAGKVATPEEVFAMTERISELLEEGDQLDDVEDGVLIPAIPGNADQIPAIGADLPRYKCHKEVRAVKIKELSQAPADQERLHAGGDWYLMHEEGITPILVGHDEYVLKHNPEPGGYFVVYEDGYKSYSPAKAFEAGYTRI